MTALAPAQEMTSEGLLALPPLQSVAGRRVLLVKGSGGRNKIRTELEHRGATVEELACYERLPPKLQSGDLASKLTQWEIAAILLSSGEGLENLGLLLSPTETTKFSDICLVGPAQRVAQLAIDAGFSHVVTAANASDAAMLQALTTWNAARENNQ